MSTHLLPVPHRHPTNRLVDLHTNLANLCLQCLHNKKSVPQQAIHLLNISILNPIHFNNTFCRCTCKVYYRSGLEFLQNHFLCILHRLYKNQFLDMGLYIKKPDTLHGVEYHTSISNPSLVMNSALEKKT